MKFNWFTIFGNNYEKQYSSPYEPMEVQSVLHINTLTFLEFPSWKQIETSDDGSSVVKQLLERLGKYVGEYIE